MPTTRSIARPVSQDERSTSHGASTHAYRSIVPWLAVATILLAVLSGSVASGQPAGDGGACTQQKLDAATPREAVQMCPGASSQVRHAESQFWYAFHNQCYNLIPDVQEALESAHAATPASATCSNFLMKARLGFLSTWVLAEVSRIPPADFAAIDKALIGSDTRVPTNVVHGHGHPTSHAAGPGAQAKGPNMAPRNCCQAGAHCPKYVPLYLGCTAEDAFEDALTLANGFVPGTASGHEPKLQVPYVEGAGKLLPAVVQGFYAGSFGFSRHAAGETAAKANQWEEKLLRDAIDQTGWFNVATPPALAENTDPVTRDKEGRFVPSPYQIGGQNFRQMWELFAMCADKTDQYGDYGRFTAPDAPSYMKQAAHDYENAAWRKAGDVPSDEIFELFCVNNVNVPHAFQGNYLYLGDTMIVGCALFPELQEACGDDWIQVATKAYEKAQASGRSSGWALQALIDQRIELVEAIPMVRAKSGENPFQGLIDSIDRPNPLGSLLHEISDTAKQYPVCMVCHHN